MTKILKKFTTTPLWRTIKRGKDPLLNGLNMILDVVDPLFGKKNELVPPRRLIFIGNGDFLRTGNEFLDYFKRLGGIRPDHRLLDVGCGIGRMAVPLTIFLSNSGSYEGFDIVPHGIQWCSEKITPRFPNFHFQLADISNQEYNPKGLVTAAEFQFPYEDESFDFIFLTSVFTHMLPKEVENYLSEIQRVLKPGGTCLITWFLLNHESESCIKKGNSSLDFIYPLEGCLTVDFTLPEKAIAYDATTVLNLYSKLGLILEQPIHFGSWCGRVEHLSYQDICIAKKPVVS